MTPAIKLLQSSGHAFQIHEYSHDRRAPSYGEAAAEKLGIDSKQVFKTLVVATAEAKLAVAVLPVPSRLSMKAVAKIVGTRKCEMADPLEVQRKTGYVLGGVSPLGQKTRLDTLIDMSATSFDTVYVSAGRRGLEIALTPGLLIELTNARRVSLAV